MPSTSVLRRRAPAQPTAPRRAAAAGGRGAGGLAATPASVRALLVPWVRVSRVRVPSVLVLAALLLAALVSSGPWGSNAQAQSGLAAQPVSQSEAPAAPPAPSPEALAEEGLVRSEQMNRGALLFQTDVPGYFVPAPLLSTEVEMAITGPIARTTVTQAFTNPADVFVEGRYLFPLPEGAAVDTLRMRVGDRLIEGEIEERQAAKRIYETAKAAGYVASLVEQERPNVFTTSVANIAPQARVVVQIEYQESLTPRDGAFGVRVPLVVAPRYSPEPRPLLASFGPEGWTPVAVDPAPDRDRIAAAVIDPRTEDPSALRNPVEISIDLDAGFPLGAVKSLYHTVAVTETGPNAARIVLEAPAPADRDFYLSWTPEPLATPHLALFSETTSAPASAAGPPTDAQPSPSASTSASTSEPPAATAADEAAYYLLMLAPPARETIGADPRPREVIFVQDVSGSMSFAGDATSEDASKSSIDQAKAGLELALRRLDPRDTFNVVVFNDAFAAFHPRPIPATPENIEQAVAAVRALQADGGTEMLPALEFALRDDTPNDGRVRQVIFLTDGAVGNEREMIALINRDLGQTRLFTVGIGSAPNSYFMVSAAEAGRGSHVFIGDLAEVQTRMAELFAKIETPAITDLSLSVAGLGQVETHPMILPDLYVGDPLTAVIIANPDEVIGALPEAVLRGRIAGASDEAAVWTQTIALADAQRRAGVSKLVGKRRIDSLEALRLSPDVTEEDRKQIDAEILATALQLGLVSRVTSLVAVDVTPTRPAGAELAEGVDAPLNLPAGWDASAFFADPPAPAPATDPTAGPRPINATPDAGAPLVQPAALGRLASAASLRAAQAASSGAPLPATSLDWRAWLPLAGGLVLLGGVLILWARRGGRADAA